MNQPDYTPWTPEELSDEVDRLLRISGRLTDSAGEPLEEVADTSVHNATNPIDYAAVLLQAESYVDVSATEDVIYDVSDGITAEAQAAMDAYMVKLFESVQTTEDEAGFSADWSSMNMSKYEQWAAMGGYEGTNDAESWLDKGIDGFVETVEDALGLVDEIIPVLDPVTSAILEAIGKAVGKIAGEMTVAFLEVTIPMAMKFTEGIFEGLATVDIDTDRFKQSFKDMTHAMQEAMTELGAELQ